MSEEPSGPLQRGRSKKAFLYRQLSSILRRQIADGTYAPGERLPSMDDLAETYHLNKVTVRTALGELASEGLIHSVPAQGTFVSIRKRAPGVEPHRNALMVGVLSPVMIPNCTGKFHLSLLEAIRNELQALSGNLVLLPAAKVRRQAELIPMLNDAVLHAVICIGPIETAVLRRIAELPMPSVLVDHLVPGLGMDAVAVDNRGGAYRAVSHLIGLGHRNIAILSGEEEQPATGERMRGAMDALAEHHIKGKPRAASGAFNLERGYEAMKVLLRARPRPTAVFCMNDEMAAGALRAAHEASCRVPEDVSVVGFDDVPLAAMLHPQLTTVRTPCEKMARLAVQSLKDQIERDGGSQTPAYTTLATTLIERASTASPRRSR